MLDIKLIRERPEFIKAELEKVGFPGRDLEVLLELDRRRRAQIHETESLKARRPARSQEIRTIADPQQREAAIAEMRALGDRLVEMEKAVNGLEEEFQRRLLEIPNLPHPGVPVGRDDSENVVVRTAGAPRQFSFQPKPHWNWVSSSA
jgi:seryl-tRNA synthetase